jgi:hypothetical protein
MAQGKKKTGNKKKVKIEDLPRRHQKSQEVSTEQADKVRGGDGGGGSGMAPTLHHK